MYTTKQKIILILSVFFLTFSVPLFAGARGLVPCGGYTTDTSQTREAPCTVSSIFVLFARVTNWLLGLVGLFAVFKIIQAGFNLVISQGEEEKITQNKKAITYSVLGVCLSFLAFVLINTVVNFLLANQTPGCTVDLTNPTTYLTSTTVCNSTTK